MRVITGKAKGHKLIAPKGLNVRPTADKVKESIFNIIGSINEDCIVLDLFAGSGAIGIEFLSRGASLCYFIDNNIISIKHIKKNLENTKLLSNARIYRNDVSRALTVMGKKKIKFDFIFMDPPYERNLVIPNINIISQMNLLKYDGLLIVEHESKKIFPELIFNLEKVNSRIYGSTSITFYKSRRQINGSNLPR